MGINVTDYRYLFEALNNKSSGVDSFGRFELNNIGSKGIQSQLRAAGIDTNSKAYKKVVGDMMRAGGGRGFANIQGIKNLMNSYDENGDFISPVTGLTGMDATNIPISQRHLIIDIPEKSRQEMFDNAKREFLQENGVANGDTTKRSDVFYHYQKDAKKENRLKGTWTLEQYERQYNKAFEDAVKSADPSWKPGKKIPAGALDGITRDSIDKSLVKTKGRYGETFTRGIDMRL
ncbi:MAG: DUF3879 family protein [Lachnospiraceae bacterium]|nr:DUF3879 family protein [Lachnospiraceae bacterium]